MAVHRSGRLVAALLVALLAIAVVAIPASAVPFDEADFSGYATGQVLHADALHATGVNVANVEEAWTGAAVDSKGLTSAIKNEAGLDRTVIAAQPTKKTAGRGSGLELGLGVDDDTANDLQIQIAEAAAPPNTSTMDELLGLPASPIAYASLLRGAAEANWSNSSTCVLGKDLSNGLGYAANVELVETGTTDPEGDGNLDAPLISVNSELPADRRVAQSFSHTFLDVQQNAAGNPLGLRFGLSSEVRMTIAPVTLADGALTLDFLGEWVLRATAGGIPGSSHIHFGPGEASPSTPILRIIQDGEITDIITFQDILGDEGLPIIIPGVLELVIGENPRAIGGDDTTEPSVAANGTSASAALDVVRVKVLDGEALDLRFGHMEVAAQVPVGGIDCGIPVSKTSNLNGVTVGQAFTTSIKVDNPFGCDMTVVKVVDKITTEGDAKFQVLSTSPTANQVPAGSNLDSGTVVWDNIGPIAKGGSKTVSVTLRAQGGGGIIEDIATAAAVLGNCDGEGDGSTVVGNSPPLKVLVVLKAKFLPETGVGTSGAFYVGALSLLSLAGVSIRSLRRTKP
ncbi:MAG: hypothetical protein WEB06_11800 [Actinomycetota bacterium]